MKHSLIRYIGRKCDRDANIRRARGIAKNWTQGKRVSSMLCNKTEIIKLLRSDLLTSCLISSS